MRIIGGQARGRPLTAPRGQRTRPTPSRVREALFSMLDARLGLQDLDVLDLYAGSGALGLEALSRGARAVTLIDNDRGCRDVIQKNAQRLGFSKRCTIRQQSVRSALGGFARQQRTFDLVLADPPYDLDTAVIVDDIARHGVLSVDGWVVVEHRSTVEPPAAQGRLVRQVARRFGDSALTLYAAVGPATDTDAETETETETETDGADDEIAAPDPIEEGG